MANAILDFGNKKKTFHRISDPYSTLIRSCSSVNVHLSTTDTIIDNAIDDDNNTFCNMMMMMKIPYAWGYLILGRWKIL